MIVIAWILAVAMPLNVIIGFCLIDRPREPKTAEGYVIDCIGWTCIFILCGRILGWW